MSRLKGRKSPTNSRLRYYLVGVVVTAAIVGYLVVSAASQGHSGTRTTTQQASTTQAITVSKPIILYVNQGNGVVNSSNFGELLSTATSHGFNTIFFQVYRSGTLLFSDSSLSQLVASAHGAGLKFYFALYFTNATQTIPSSIYADGEDGVNLDMSTLPISAQTTLFNDLSSAYSGRSAITTTDPTLPLKPTLLIIETYGSGNDQYIHPGIVASVGVFATSSRQDYDQQFQYALDNSDGVMVFDYAGLVKAGY